MCGRPGTRGRRPTGGRRPLPAPSRGTKTRYSSVADPRERSHELLARRSASRRQRPRLRVSSEIPIIAPARPGPSRAARGAAPASARARRTRGRGARISARRSGSASRSRTVAASSSAEKPERTTPAARVADERLRAAARRGDDGEAGGERLRGRDPEALLVRGQDEERRPAQVRGDRGHDSGRLDAVGKRRRAGGEPIRSTPRLGQQRQRVEQQADVLPRVVRAADEASTGSSSVRAPLLVRRGRERVDVDRDRQDPDLGLVEPAGPRDARAAPRRRSRRPASRAAQHAALEPAEDRRVHADREPAGGAEARAAGPPTRQRARCRSSRVRPAATERGVAVRGRGRDDPDARGRRAAPVRPGARPRAWFSGVDGPEPRRHPAP